MFGTFEGIRIAAISSLVPETVFDNFNYLEGIEDKKTKKQVKLTGIKERHVLLPGQTITRLAASAARMALEKASWSYDDIRIIVFVTQTPSLTAPSTAMLIQKELGIGWDCLAFDVNLGCSGYVSGLQVVSALLKNTRGRALLIVGDAVNDRNPEQISKDTLMYGCGVSATAIELSDSADAILYSQYTDGSRYEALYITREGKTIMDGNEVLLFSQNEVCDAIKNMKTHFDISESDIDFYAFHQSQKIAIEGIAYECGIPLDKVLISYDKYGNTSSASIPISICNNTSRLKKHGEVTLLLCGFGIGLAWNTAIIRLRTDAIHQIELLREN